MTGVFVTGTDTGIGKTLVSAWLVRHWRADYWKPVQTGTVEGRDLDVIRRQGVPGDGRRPTLFPSAYEFSAPLSPHAAAALEGAEIVLDRLTAPASELLVVEGAGGALVPLNGQFLMVDLMVRLGLPVLVVARSGLGTINHTLLTLEALRARHLRIAGVVMSG
ncbi:MAG: dethiobiotin synthase, partial [Rhodospirillales bacterium]|nr:dethiobiotin synthase [Rhodospirillales bacterium]